MVITQTLWNMAISLLQDINPELSQKELETLAARGFALFINPNEYICNLLEI